MAQHTPGPWRQWGWIIERVYIESPGVEVGGIVKIATVHRADGDNTANARLIAASPELLEALKGMIKLGYDICYTYSGDQDAYDAAMNAAEAAVRKAEGQL